MDSNLTVKTSPREVEIVGAIQELPMLPTLAARVVALAHDPESSAQEICDAIRADPSLTARILRIVNSSYYSLPRRIDTVAQATVMLGTSEIVGLVLGSSALKVLGGTGRRFPEQEAFWLHSVCSAVAAREVTQQFRYRVPGVAFVAGLLHDAGKLVLFQRFPEEFRQVAERAATMEVPPQFAEEAIFGTDHPRVGAALARRWGLPDGLVEAIAFHHAPGRASEENALLVDMVHLADALAHGLTDEGAAAPGMLDASAVARLRQVRVDFDASYVDKLLHDLKQAIERSEGLIAALGVKPHAAAS